jgi:ABC-2 type transport system permease protein
MPYNVMPAWLRTIASVNPLSFAIDAIRAVEAGQVPLMQIGLLSVLSVVIIALCMQVFRRMTV